MVYDTGKRILYIRDDKEIKLSKLEHKLLICLSSGNVATLEEIQKTLFLNDVSYIKVVVFRLIEKSEFYLTIRTVRGVGYRLKTEMFYR